MRRGTRAGEDSCRETAVGRCARQNSRAEDFPGVREKSLKKFISPTLPSFLFTFSLPPSPTPLPE